MLPRMHSARRRGFCAALLAALVPCLCGAAGYPERSIRFIVPFAPGGGADATARIIAEQLGRALQQPVIVENKPGGDSTIGADFVAKSPPDGYTLLFGTNTAMSGAPALRKVVPYDPVRDFTHISLIGRFSYFLVTSNDFAPRTMKDLVAYARANPGKVNYATGNAMGIVATAQLMASERIDMVHVPYKGEAPALVDLMTNRVQIMFTTGYIIPHVKDNKVRALVTVLDERGSALPDVPTVAESGYPQISIRAWAGLFGPANMPRDVTQRLSRELTAVLRLPAVQEQLAVQGFAGEGSTPEELAEITKEQLQLWGRAVREAGIKPE
jgi:tripartite-type tricarboxylate transporter receptor subunit TctC